MSGDSVRPAAGDFRHLTYAHRDGASWITLEEPERGNSLHPGSIAELLSAVRRAARDDARVLVLAARGRFFSVGGDLQSLPPHPTWASSWMTWRRGSIGSSAS